MVGSAAAEGSSRHGYAFIEATLADRPTLPQWQTVATSGVSGMPRPRSAPERQLNQLTLVSTPYVTQLVRTVAHVRSIRSGRGVSMAEVFRSIVEGAGPELEKEVAAVLGRKSVEAIRRLREADDAGRDPAEPAAPDTEDQRSRPPRY